MTRHRPDLVGAITVLILLFHSTSCTDTGSEAGAEVAARVRTACSSCHLFPPPDSLPRSAWRSQIENMKFLVGYLPASQNGASVEFDVQEVVDWYESRAPERFPAESTLTRDKQIPIRFRKQFISLGPEGGPGIAAVQRVQAGSTAHPDPLLALPNMMNGSIHLFSLKRGPRRIGNAGHPVHVAVGDMDGDGIQDLVISDLGDPMPTDEPVGRVLIATRTDSGAFHFETVLDGIGRVADARPTDLDGDGDLDIVVAAFGWLRSGGIYVLTNETSPEGPLDFRVEQVVARSGAVSVLPVEDLQPGTGRGFVVAFAQHHEQVSLFYPAEQGYEERVLFRAPHPVFGMSNLEAIDLDRDSDTDFLLTHGDTLDDGVPFKSDHGVEWLENLGDGEFRAHRIGGLYGAHRAEAADLDGDGDIDVVATGFLPQVKLPVESEGKRVDSVIWFERVQRKKMWLPWSIEVNHPLHTGMALVDLNGDGRLDVVAGVNRAWDGSEKKRGPALEAWFNLGRR